MVILARSLPGNLTIWREILTFEIKKYIRNSGKSDYLAGKNTLFQAVLVCSHHPLPIHPKGSCENDALDQLVCKLCNAGNIRELCQILQQMSPLICGN